MAEVGKIALRREGTWWVAFYQGHKRFEIARVRMSIAENEPEVKAAFIEFTKLIVTKALAAVGGAEVLWNEPRPAPESERSGNA